MTPAKFQREELGPVAMALAPLALWVMLWLGIGGEPAWIVNQAWPMGQSVRGILALSPVVAGVLAVGVLLVKLKSQRQQRFLFLNPLGLAFVYGLVGIASLALSPDKPVALYWTAVYVSVPLVLWAVVWGADPLGNLVRIINFTWLVIVLGTVVLFSIGLLYMDLESKIGSPSALLRCEPIGHWFSVTFGNLRSTGVGRYAAITGIIAFGALWQGRYRWAWVLILLGAFILLMTTSARTAMIGFVPAIVLMALLHSRKKAVIAGLLSIIALLLINLTTDLDQNFLGECFLKGKQVPEVSRVIRSLIAPTQEQAAVEQPKGAGAQVQEQALVQQPEDAGAQVREQPAVEQRDTARVQLGETSQSPELLISDFLMREEPPYTQPVSAKVVKEAASSIVRVRDQLPVNRPVNPGLFSGRSSIWQQGWSFIKQSPVLGFGFHADRLLMDTQMHNAYLHAGIQTGIIGTLFFAGALVSGWLVLYKVVRHLAQLPDPHRQIVTQTAGLLTFLSVRSLAESSGAFFGVDWILLVTVLLYLGVVAHSLPQLDNSLPASQI